MTKNDLQFLTRFLPKKVRILILGFASWSESGELFTTDLDSWALVTTDQHPENDVVFNVKCADTLAKNKSTFHAEGDVLTVDGMEVPATGLTADELPVWPEYGVIRAYATFQPGELHSAITTVMTSASEDESRLVLTGICFDFTHKDAPVMVTTDTHRLTIVPIHPVIEETGAVLNDTFIVPSTKLKKLLPFLKDAKTAVTVTFTDTMTIIHFDNKTLATKNVDGQFPNYERVIPRTKGTYVSFNRAELAERLKSYTALAKINKVHGGDKRFVLQPGEENEPCLTHLWGDLGSAGKYTPAPIETSMPIPFTIAFNGQYLLDVTNQFPASEYVTIEFSDGPLRPQKITGTGSDTLIVLMPMSVID